MGSERENLQDQDSAPGEPTPASAQAEAANEGKTAAAQCPGFRGQGPPCSACGGFTIPESGCWVCMCGWTKSS